MANSLNSASSFALPHLKSILRVGPNPQTESIAQIWDVKFYPYDATDEAEPIFAIIESETALICRLVPNDEETVHILHALALQKDQDDGTSNAICSCTWCFVDEAEPILVVAGDIGQLMIFDAIKGILLTTLIGHGLGTINDLATHPMYPWIVASASKDASVRIWDLRRWSNTHESSCIIICGHGQGHKEGILTVSWHDSGRYLVTGGHDHRICVWTIPDLNPQSSFWFDLLPENRKRSSDEVRVIHYPHFVSSAVHSNYVDCIRFYGDIIISKAAEEHKLVLWKITGFNPRLSPPTIECAPKTNDHLETRNGFIRTIRNSDTDVNSDDVAELYKYKPPYERLLELHVPHCQSFYIRFGLLRPSTECPDIHAIVACGNTRSQVFFWDLDRLEQGYDDGVNENSNDNFRVPAKKKKGGTTRLKPPDRLGQTGGLIRSASLDVPSSPTSSHRSSSIGTFDSAVFPRQSSTGATSNTSELMGVVETRIPNRVKYPISNPHEPLKHHKEVTLTEFHSKNLHFTTRAADWSSCGRWCIVVGEAQGGFGAAAIFERWT